jgi:nitrogen fixation protein FixH
MKKGSWWPAIIASALALHVVASLIVVYLATSDPSYAVEEDYYQKAVNWSEKQAQDRRNDELGWSLTFAVTPPTTPGGYPTIEVNLAGITAEPLASATVSLETFHKARSEEIIRITLEPSGDAGRYIASPAMRHNGLWELRFTVTKGADTFTHNETRHLFVEGSWQ